MKKSIEILIDLHTQMELADDKLDKSLTELIEKFGIEIDNLVMEYTELEEEEK